VLDHAIKQPIVTGRSGSIPGVSGFETYNPESYAAKLCFQGPAKLCFHPHLHVLETIVWPLWPNFSCSESIVWPGGTGGYRPAADIGIRTTQV